MARHGMAGSDMTNANQKSERPICSVSSLDALLDIGDDEEKRRRTEDVELMPPRRLLD